MQGLPVLGWLLSPSPPRLLVAQPLCPGCPWLCLPVTRAPFGSEPPLSPVPTGGWAWVASPGVHLAVPEDRFYGVSRGPSILHACLDLGSLLLQTPLLWGHLERGTLRAIPETNPCSLSPQLHATATPRRGGLTRCSQSQEAVGWGPQAPRWHCQWEWGRSWEGTGI